MGNDQSRQREAQKHSAEVRAAAAEVFSALSQALPRLPHIYAGAILESPDLTYVEKLLFLISCWDADVGRLRPEEVSVAALRRYVRMIREVARLRASPPGGPGGKRLARASCLLANLHLLTSDPRQRQLETLGLAPADRRSAGDWRWLAGLGLVVSRPGGFYAACPTARHAGLEAREARRWCSRAYLQLQPLALPPAAAVAGAGAGALQPLPLLTHVSLAVAGAPLGQSGYGYPYQQPQYLLPFRGGAGGAGGAGGGGAGGAGGEGVMIAGRGGSVSSAGGGGGGHVDLAAALAAAVKRRAMGSLDLPLPPPSAHPLPGLTEFGFEGGGGGANGHRHGLSGSYEDDDDEAEGYGEVEQPQPRSEAGGDHDADGGSSSVFSLREGPTAAAHGLQGQGQQQQPYYPPPLPAFPNFMHHALAPHEHQLHDDVATEDLAMSEDGAAAPSSSSAGAGAGAGAAAAYGRYMDRAATAGVGAGANGASRQPGKGPQQPPQQQQQHPQQQLGQGQGGGGGFGGSWGGGGGGEEESALLAVWCPDVAEAEAVIAREAILAAKQLESTLAARWRRPRPSHDLSGAAAAAYYAQYAAAGDDGATAAMVSMFDLHGGPGAAPLALMPPPVPQSLGTAAAVAAAADAWACPSPAALAAAEALAGGGQELWPPRPNAAAHCELAAAALAARQRLEQIVLRHYPAGRPRDRPFPALVAADPDMRPYDRAMAAWLWAALSRHLHFGAGVTRDTSPQMLRDLLQLVRLRDMWIRSHLAYLLYLPDLEAAYGPLLPRTPYGSSTNGGGGAAAGATTAAAAANGGAGSVGAGALRSVSSANSSVASSYPPTSRPHGGQTAGAAPPPPAYHPAGGYGSSPARGGGGGGAAGLAAAALASSAAPYGLPAAAQRRLAAAWEALLHAEAASHVLGWLAGARAKRLPYGQLRERLGAEMPGACNAYGGSEALAGAVLVRLLRDLLVRLPRPLEADLAAAAATSGAYSGSSNGGGGCGGGGRRSDVGRAAGGSGGHGGKGGAGGDAGGGTAGTAGVFNDDTPIILCEDFLAFQMDGYAVR
ncbi:hypothetical protein HYH02_012900 [Chlamydomonas schloesseri]|uniref:Uncharacterized protein n=1 Tax=Chlamydomonas schloesseri TaxID=2026947 RepID=A0A835SZ75_9CHLO|nr:hypothetical protein HYH02_012900 [Chlamydomonas schloesseri]|eukprot:KAG2432768.1 hypothetical protein HYH02_012900 [Chlamydomonas schloesseri]